MLEGKRVILASGSPRRAELLKKIVDKFEIIVSDIDESHCESLPQDIATTLAKNKAEAVSKMVCDDSAVIIAADTLVWHNGKELGKPTDYEDAVAMLTELSGSRHTVCTGVCVLCQGKSAVFSVSTEVEFYPLTENEIRKYVETGEPMDKSGSYGIQDGAAIFVRGVNGDYPTVMGLPVAELYRKLKELNL